MMNVRNEPVHVMACVVKRETPPPYGGGNFVSFNMEKVYQNRNNIGWRGSVMPVAETIFGPLSQTHFSKSEFKDGFKFCFT